MTLGPLPGREAHAQEQRAVARQLGEVRREAVDVAGVDELPSRPSTTTLPPTLVAITGTPRRSASRSAIARP